MWPAAGQEALLITCENDSEGPLRARRSRSYASRSTEIVFVATSVHTQVRTCSQYTKTAETREPLRRPVEWTDRQGGPNIHPMRRRSLFFFVSLALAACVSVNKSILAPNPTGRTFQMEEVYVYLGQDTVPEHTRLAILNAHGDTDVTDESDLIDKLREEAGKLGANAIILDEIEEPGTGARIAAAILDVETERQTQALAIYVPSRDPARN